MSSLLIETNFSEVETISESATDANGEKQWYINGIFAQADVVNKNRRLYPGAVLENCMNDYNDQYVMKNRAVGEAEHPDTTKVNIDRISHIIVPGSLIREGSNWSAKAKILNTPCGNIVKGLLEGGVQIGVSTRAGGAVQKNANGIMEVQDGLKMSAIDIVFSPSAPDALVQGLMENDEMVWDSIQEIDHEILEQLQEDIHSTKATELAQKKLDTFKQLMSIVGRR